MDFRKLVTDKIQEIGTAEASKFFGVALGTVSNWKSGKVDPPLHAVQRVCDLLNLDLQVAKKDDDLTSHQDVIDEVQWVGKDVIMLLPVYKTFNPRTHYSLFANYARYGPEKIGMMMETRTLIYEARNILVDKALKNTDANWLLFVDDDMILPLGNASVYNNKYGAGLPERLASMCAIPRIMSHPGDRRIVGGLYFGRFEKGKAQCCSGFSKDGENDKFRKFVYQGLKQEDWVGTGFLKIHRSVFEDLKKEIDAGKYPECLPIREDKWYGFFTPMRVGIGEDVSFGRRCTELGIKSYVDTSLICLHCGDAYYGVRNTHG